MSGSVTVDNASSRIQYSSGWNPGDVHTTGAGGSSATFNFVGNIVSVVGTIPQGSGEEIRVDFSVDGRAATSVTRRTGSNRATGEVWFSSGYLETYSPHTVVVIFRSGPQFQLEQFRYEGAPGPGEPEPQPPVQTPPPTTTSIPPTPTRSVPPSSDPTTTSDPTSTRQTSTTNTPTTTDTDTDTDTDSSTDSDSSTSSPIATNTGGGSAFVPNPSDAATLPGGEASNAGQEGATKAATPTGAIVGAVVGSLALLAMLVIVLILLRRRKRAIALADVSLRDDTMGPYGSSASYAHSATGLMNYNSSAPPPVYTPPQSVVYIPQPVTKRRMSNGSGGHGSGQEHFTDTSHSNNYNYNHNYNAGQPGPSQQYYDSGASISGSTNFAGLGTGGSSGSGIPMQQMHNHSAAQNPMVHHDTSDTASSAYSAYTGIARSETAVQRSLGHGASGHQQHPSVSVASDVSAPASLTPLRRQDAGYSQPPPAY